MALEKVDVGCIGKLDAREAIRLSGLKPEELIDCNIADIGAGVNIFGELIAKEAQGCDILLIDTIYESPEIFSREVEWVIKAYNKDLTKLMELHNMLPEFQKDVVSFASAKAEIERTIHLLNVAKRIESLLGGVEETVGNDNRIQRLSEFPADMKGTMHYVCITSLFYKIHEPMEFLAEVDSYLAEDGKIILIDPRGTYEGGGKYNIDSMLEFLRKIGVEGQEKLGIRIISEDHQFFSSVEIQKGAYNRVKFPKNK